MNTVNRIIMLRHGETTSNKSDINRSLTKYGSEQIISVSKLLKKQYNFNQKNCIILSTNNQRAIDTATIISKQVKALYRQDLIYKVDTFCIKDWSPLKKMQLQNFPEVDLTELYFQLYQSKNLPLGFPSPSDVARNFISLINNLDIQSENIVLVGNGGTLEAASYFQNRYIPINNSKKILAYAQYVELVKC